MKKGKTLVQLVKYGIVGVMNTLVTIVVIFVCKAILGINPWVSNAIGYIAGVVNSFLWNKKWVFKSRNGYVAEAVKFLIGFLPCYLVQLAAVWLLTECTPLGDMTWTIGGFTFGGYGVATLIGMVVYTIANFLYNRYITFRKLSLKK